MKPKFKFMEEVLIKDPFYGELRGCIVGAIKMKRGIWPFRKNVLMYQVDVEVKTHQGVEIATAVLPEEDIYKIEKKKSLKLI